MFLHKPNKIRGSHFLLLKRVAGIFLCSAILMYPKEAWVSSNAGFTILEPYFQYSFYESNRKILRAGDEGAYWKNKNNRFNRVLKNAEPQFEKFVSAVNKARISMVPFRLTKEMDKNTARTTAEIAQQSLSKSVHLIADGHLGTTELWIQVDATLGLKESETLLELFNDIQFEKLEENTSDDTVPVNEGELLRGLVVAEHFEQFSLGVSLTSTIRAKNLNRFKKEMQGVLKKIAPEINDGFKDQVSKNLFWGEPADLISLKQKTGSRFDAIANETDPAKSVFNPYGPLFDDFGRRSSTQAGSLQISMLFLTQGAWNDKSPLAGQRGQFEHWLHVISQRLIDPIN